MQFHPARPSGRQGPFTFAINTPLPAWAAFNPNTGIITGTTNTITPSALPFIVTVQDAAGRQSKQTFTLFVGTVPLTTTLVIPEVNCGELNACTSSIPFTPVTASGGFGTLSYALTGGGLPGGLNFTTATGALSGTLPTTPLALTSYTVSVTDQTAPSAQISSKTFGLSMLISALSGQNSCFAGSFCTITPVIAQGGKGPVSWSLSGGGLPAGFTFNFSAGTISGIAFTPGSFPLSILATDMAGRIAGKSVTIDVVMPLIVESIGEIECSDEDGCFPNLPFAPISATGGVGNKTYTLSGGVIPAGLSFSSSTGIISGTILAGLAGTVFTITVTDQSTPPQSGSAVFLFSALRTAITGASSCTAGVACNVTPVSAAGGKGSPTWLIGGADADALAALGLSLSPATGAITGASPIAGVAPNIAITVFGGGGGLGSTRTVTITMN